MEGLEVHQQVPAQGRSRKIGISATLRDDKEPLSTSVVKQFQTIPPHYPVANYAFDITPAHYITAYITETGAHNKLIYIKSC